MEDKHAILEPGKNVTKKNAQIRIAGDKKGKGESELDKLLQPEQNSCQGEETGPLRPESKQKERNCPSIGTMLEKI